LRFHPEEEANDAEFARKLAGLADFYVNDAFSVSHRSHASVDAITHFIPAVAGLQMERELEMLGRTLEQPRRPLGAIVGGAKVSDKMIVLEQLQEKADFLLIGGGMVATFLHAQGFSVGNSPVEKDRIDFAAELLANSTAKGCKILLPSDVVIAAEFKKEAVSRMVAVKDIPNESLIMDIGSQSVVSYTDALYQCKTVIWNGPMGVFEWEQFADGTKGIAHALGNLEDATTLVGGGSTAEAIASLGLTEKITLVSTGGGATLEFLEGRELPGVVSLQDKN
jgi:phosphoglycerate kinase